MTTPNTNSVHFHRVLKAPAARIFRAFTDAAAMAKWLPPYGFVAKSYQHEAQVGGTYRMSFTNFSTGSEMFFGGSYLEIVSRERVVYTAVFDDPNLPGEMTTTVVLREVSCGTEIKITQEGLPAVIPVDGCYLGWQESLAQLAKLVEPEIPE